MVLRCHYQRPNISIVKPSIGSFCTLDKEIRILSIAAASLVANVASNVAGAAGDSATRRW